MQKVTKTGKNILRVATVLAGAFEAAIPRKSPETKGQIKMTKSVKKCQKVYKKFGKNVTKINTQKKRKITKNGPQKWTKIGDIFR